MMKKSGIAGLACAAALLLAPSALTQGDANSAAEAVARTYMAHYSDLELDAMAAMLSEDVAFRDPTAETEEFGFSGLSNDGRDALMGLLREFIDTYQPIELGFEWDQVYTSNSRVVFIGHVNALYPTQTEGQRFRWRSQQVSVITVQNGVVIRHEDFANYATPEQGLVPAVTEH
ncbi:nuclear transport factor 2 family protein [Maricaulis sp.]|uniref:nuclear transport factor 2 family protein n=1 Tax=Maricaulis sp. TaxID=1486257 RepID=UPI002B271119|nr:nuclear transport factor 2 family protein [Maricaulis sp.]